MKYFDFLEQFKDYPVITGQDIRNVFGVYNHTQMIGWQNQGRLVKLKRGIFALPGRDTDIHVVANRLNPSYISLEYALSYYQMIPDIARTVTSVSKNRHEQISNALGEFHYRKIAPALYTGFTLLQSRADSKYSFRIALPEKALFDLVYFRPDLREAEDFRSLRLTLDRRFRPTVIKEYFKMVRARGIRPRIAALIEYIKSA